MEIAIVIYSLVLGGAERTASHLAKGLRLAGHKVTFVTLANSQSDFYQLDPGIKRVSLQIAAPSGNPAQAIGNNLRRVAKLRSELVALRPDLVISMMPETNITVLLALRQTGIPIIVTEHSNPTALPIKPAWDTLRRMVYPLADQLVSVSRGTDNYFAWLKPAKRSVIPNALDIDELAISMPSEQLLCLPPVSATTIVALGRLSYEKGYDLLIKAFQRIAHLFPQWNVVIVGEGNQRPLLEQMLAEHELQTRVHLCGMLRHPHAYIHGAGFLVLPSRSEGFGNVLVEAFGCNLPVVAFDCPTGPGEIVTDGYNGILVPPEDVSALAEAMATLMANPGMRDQLAKHAATSAEGYQLSAVMQRWQELFDRMQLLPRGPEQAPGAEKARA